VKVYFEGVMSDQSCFDFIHNCVVIVKYETRIPWRKLFGTAITWKFSSWNFAM